MTILSATNPLSFPLRLCASARVLVFIDGPDDHPKNAGKRYPCQDSTLVEYAR